ncbi:MAG: VWA domain-containing protein [Beijerinckiaceae bacterium]
MTTALPPAARPFVAFPTLLRQYGFMVAPEQTVAFLTSIELLGPKSLEHIRRAAVATLAPPPDRRDVFDALFDFHFLDGAVAADGDQEFEPDEEMKIEEDTGEQEIILGEEINETGREATGAEALAVRQLKPLDESELLRRFVRDLPAALPRRRGYRRRRAKRGPGIDLARSLKNAIRTDGDVMALKRWKKSERPRPILLLIDVSGSMKQRTDANLVLAHAVLQSAPRVEVFTFGTRLTRLTRTLRPKNQEQALSAASSVVADLDGGTRIGDALQAFLAVPRFGGYARGASVVILSDGLERGDPSALINAMRRFAARAWRIDWLTPLASDAGYQPQTEALVAIRPLLHSLADGGSTASICRRILSLGQNTVSGVRAA